MTLDQRSTFISVYRSKALQIIIGFMNADGIVAYGRLWKFHFSLNRERMDGNVQPLQFAELIASSVATVAIMESLAAGRTIDLS